MSDLREKGNVDSTDISQVLLPFSQPYSSPFTYLPAAVTLSAQALRSTNTYPQAKHEADVKDREGHENPTTRIKTDKGNIPGTIQLGAVREQRNQKAK